MIKTPTASEHRAAAIEHHELAALCFHTASQYFKARKYAHATHLTLTAHGHTERAHRHTSQASQCAPAESATGSAALDLIAP